MTPDNFDALLGARWSCRAYLDTPVPDAEIEAAIQSAGRAPSWCNAQPWQVIALGPEATADLRRDLYAHASSNSDVPDVPFPKGYEGLHAERRRTCGWQLYDAVGVKKGDRAGSARQMFENFRLFGAPNFLVITTPKHLGAYGVLDCGAFVTTLTLALQSRGIASIPMASIAGFPTFFRDRFDIPDDRDLLCGIACGYPDQTHPANGFRTNRAPLPEILRWV